MIPPVLVTAPAAPIVQIADARQHLRVGHAEDDQLIALHIAAATSYLDGWTGILGRALAPQVWRQDFDGFFFRNLPLPLAPVSAIVAVRWRDEAGAEQTVPADDYQLLVDSLGPCVMLKPGRAWPKPGPSLRPVSVEFACGQPPEQIPAAIRAALLLMVGDLYANRESTAARAEAVPMSTTVAALLAPFRRVGV